MRTYHGFIIALAACASAAGAADGPLQVESRILTEQKLPRADGTVDVHLVQAKKVVPGDRVVFVLAYRNTGNQPISNIVFDNPVPKEIAYRAAGSGAQSPDLSVDGKTFGQLNMLRVTMANGGQRAATADDVTHVRWRLAAPLAAGAKGEFSFQATLK